MKNNDFFSPDEIRRRVNRQQRQKLMRLVNITITVLISVLAFFFLPLLYPHPMMRLEDRQVTTGMFIATLIAFVITWGGLLVHRIWLNGQMKIDREIEDTMRTRGSMAQYQDANAYRLSDDGELFYDEDEIEYDVKTKRKNSG